MKKAGKRRGKNGDEIRRKKNDDEDGERRGKNDNKILRVKM